VEEEREEEEVGMGLKYGKCSKMGTIRENTKMENMINVRQKV